jgi:hypothetical protein
MSSQFLLQYLNCYRDLKGDYGMTFVPLINNSYNYLAYSTSVIWDSPLLQYVSDILKLELHKVSSTNQYDVFELVIPYDDHDSVFNKILETGRTIVILQYNCDNNTFEIKDIIEPNYYESEDDDIIYKIKGWFTSLIKPNASNIIDTVTSSCSFTYCYDCDKRIFNDHKDHSCSDTETDDSAWSDNPHSADIINQDESIVESNVESTVESNVEPTVESNIEPTVESNIEPTVEPNVEPTVESNVESIIDNKINDDDFIIIDTSKYSDDYVVL